MATERKIFEDADIVRKNADLSVRQPRKTNPEDDNLVRIWLVGLLVLLLATIELGVMTRLADAGLSITEWEVVTGVLPPIGELAWNERFQLYKQIPEFTLVRPEMTLSEFKVIYWWEWTHRMAGRILGLVWLSGLVWFLMRKSLRPGWVSRLLAIGMLGGLQGIIGWWMVSSGLAGESVDVAALRLAIHHILAFVILALLVWSIMLLGREQHHLFQARRMREPSLERLSILAMALLLLQVFAGALVAGTGSGHAYPTWPLINGEFFPSEGFDLSPWHSNLFENLALVQFNHRVLGYCTVLVASIAWWTGRSSPHSATRRSFGIFLALGLGQSLVGIWTALSAATFALAMLHQCLAVLLFATAIHCLFLARYPILQSTRGESP